MTGTLISTQTTTNLHLLRRFVGVIGVSGETIASRYRGQRFGDIPKDQVFLEFLTNDIGPKTLAVIESLCDDEALSHLRDRRNPMDYAMELVIGWIMEDAVIHSLSSLGVDVSSAGTDRERNFLASGEISNSGDLKVRLNGHEHRMEIVTDFGNYWARTDECDLRDGKLRSLRDEEAWLLGVSLQKPSAFLLDTAALPNGVVAVDSVWHDLWGKPVSKLRGIKAHMRPVMTVLSQVANLA